MKQFSLTSNILGTHFLGKGIISHPDGSISKGFEMEPLSSGVLEESFEGATADAYFAKLADLLAKLPNLFEGQLLLCRKRKNFGFFTRVYAFEKCQKKESYSHLEALLREIKLNPLALTEESWKTLLAGFFGTALENDKLPDVVWEKELLRMNSYVSRALSLTELPQVTWKGCLQPIFESPYEFILSIHISIPDRTKIKRQLETKRRVSHALAVSSSLEVKNIESNSVLQSSEETLQRILVGKETLFEISMGIIFLGEEKDTLTSAHELERVVSGVGNAGLYLEGLGTLPVFKSHIPGNKMLGIRKLPILSENLSHLLPLLHDYSRINDHSALELRSRSSEFSHLNLFSKENLNFNAFICGASGSGKSFLMNAVLSSILKDDKNSRICIFDVGGSYKKIIESSGGKSTALGCKDARELISSFLKLYPVNQQGFYHAFLKTLCGSGSHITHSHSVALVELLREIDGENLEIGKIISNAKRRSERFYQDIAHWLKPHTSLDKVDARLDFKNLLNSKATAFDFKELDADPVLQKTTILLLTEILWRDLMDGRFSKTLIVFDEVWRFFAESKDFLEEMYRTLRKYKAGIVSITQNLADYGDESFAKMIFTNSFTKLFLQNGASAEFLKNTFDLPSSDIERALSVASKKPFYSEFFALSPNMSQVFRLYPTEEFYELANTENIAINNKSSIKSDEEKDSK